MLTEIAGKSAVCLPGKARARMTDASGLYLERSPTGSKRWFWKYYFASKEKRLALGTYPAVSLKQARSERDLARRTLQSGSDPSKRRQIERLERIEKDLFPWIGPVPLPEITAPMLLNTLRKIEKRGARETAHTLRQTAGQVFRYGVATGRCERNPAPDLHGALQPLNIKHMSALLFQRPGNIPDTRNKTPKKHPVLKRLFFSASRYSLTPFQISTSLVQFGPQPLGR